MNALSELPEGFTFIASGGGHRAGSDHAVDRDHQMAVKLIRLLFSGAVPVARLLGKEPAARGAGQDTQGQGAPIDEMNGIHCRPQLDDPLLMKVLFDGPEVRGLLGEGVRDPRWENQGCQC